MKLLLPVGFVVIGLALMAIPLWLAGAPLLVPLLIVGVAIFVALPMLLVTRLSSDARARPEKAPQGKL